MDADNYETDPCLKEIRRAENYSWMDIITIHKDKLPNYEEKVRGSLLWLRVCGLKSRLPLEHTAGFLAPHALSAGEVSRCKTRPVLMSWMLKRAVLILL